MAERALRKWLNMLAYILKRLAKKVVEALPALLGSVVGAVFLAKLLDLLLNIHGLCFCCRTYWGMVEVKIEKPNKVIDQLFFMSQQSLEKFTI